MKRGHVVEMMPSKKGNEEKCTSRISTESQTLKEDRGLRHVKTSRCPPL